MKGSQAINTGSRLGMCKTSFEERRLFLGFSVCFTFWFFSVFFLPFFGLVGRKKKVLTPQVVG